MSTHGKPYTTLIVENVVTGGVMHHPKQGGHGTPNGKETI